MEDKREMLRLADRGVKIKGMIDHPGWKEVLEPHLKMTRENALDLFLQATDYKKMVEIQSKVQAVDFIFSSISVVLSEGKDAQAELDTLEKEKNRDKAD